MNQSKQADKLRTYAKDKVNLVFQQMFVDLFAQQPPNVIDWSIAWLDKHGRQIISNKAKAAAQESSDDEIIELPKRPPAARKQRASVSAECYGVFNKKELFVPRVIPKTQEQRDRIASRLMEAFMFSALEEKEREIVINAMEEKHFKQGDWIITQGHEGDNLYVVDEGELDCYKQLAKDAENTHLKIYYPGESFGELALLYNSPRAASIQAKSDCVLFALDRATFNNIVRDSATKKREKFLNVLKKIDLLSVMDPYERSNVADGIRGSAIKAGTYVIREGEQGDIFYMIEEGDLIATKTLNPGEQPTKVYEYKTGDYFGELALIKNVPRQANVVATSDVRLVYLDRACFKRMLGPLEDILKRNTEKYELYAKSQ